MTTPRLTAEAGIGPALHVYASWSASTGETETVVPMAPAGNPGGDIIGGILEKVPCLLSCGIPHALSIAVQCGMDEACWLTKAPSAGLQCIKQCLA